MRRRTRSRPGLLLAGWLVASPVQACDLALALAIDVSGSVDRREYAIQMGGLADALRDPTVADALVSARAAIMVVQWTGNGRQNVALDWRRASDLAALAEIAAEIDALPRRWRNYSTAIGEALAFTAEQFAAVPGCERRVIDVSGDGTSNEGLPPRQIRPRLRDAGIVVNGLAIAGSEADLRRYFEAEVIFGPSAFVIEADGFDDYPRQIRRKLIREATVPVAAR